ncbi:MAG TPA: Rid family detoxifying hydrolase [Steroidobacteraceae bacterium]|nr:Rid family detoxifying hydrolase [Steroidobacteraceae bacterium]
MNPRLVMAPLLLALLAACVQPATNPAVARPEFLNSPESLKSGRPFSEAVRIGGFIFLAGQIGIDPATGKPAAGGIKPEARQALQSIQRLLEDNGASLADVVKCTVFLADIGEWATFNEVYKEFFRAPYPARSALGTNGLALGARVEVECLAYVEPAAH